MLKKYFYIITVLLFFVVQVHAQFKSEDTPSNSLSGENKKEDIEETDKDKKRNVPSIIKAWTISDHGLKQQASELDTALVFYHANNLFEKRSISNTFVGNYGGAYQSNDYFSRSPALDFYFSRNFDAYFLTPSQIVYFNTTTPYTLLDYLQSENRSRKNETGFNVFHSQNINPQLNFEFIYNSNKSQGQYPNQENKFHSVGLVASYQSDQFVSHSNIIFNRLQTQENGGIATDGQLWETDKTEDFVVRMEDAESKLLNNNYFTSNEYRVGKTIEADSAEYLVKTFIPRVGFIYEFEYSGNQRKFTKQSNGENFFDNTYVNKSGTNDSIRYRRLSNIFQIKFYEARDRKFTFGKHVYIGNDQLFQHFSTVRNDTVFSNAAGNEKQSNTYVGGGIFRNEGSFWQWEAKGKIYFAGYRAGQTELEGFLNKPLRIRKDTTSLKISGSLKSIVPDYFDQHFYSNHFKWENNFNPINEIIIRSSIHSQRYKVTVGANYSLLGNYIYYNESALPTQADNEFSVLSAFVNKDFSSRHWFFRANLLTQKVSNSNYLHLPVFAGYLSLNYRTLWSKVMHTQIGIDTRYNTAFYADAYQPGISKYYLQNEVKTGNYPYVDFHVNLKLKRTRFYFKVINLLSSQYTGDYYSAPDYPYYRRTFRIGVAWSFYD
jgi:hypothetical protein